MRTRISFIITFFIKLGFCQNSISEYDFYIKKADSFYAVKDYKNSTLTYSLAFKSLGWKGYPNDRYSSASSWAMIRNTDSAFYQLYRIATKSYFSDYPRLINDTHFYYLHKDKRWRALLSIIKENGISLNWSLIYHLDSIYKDDQKYRLMFDSVAKKFGYISKEAALLSSQMHQSDTINLKKIKSFLDKYGWLGQDIIGEKGNTTLFLVIQHADLTTQEKYLPIMQEAVKKGKANGSDLALLEDRVAMRQGRKQIYGSQILQDFATGKCSIYPIADEANVNRRRAEVGLEPIEEYVKHWGITYKPGMNTPKNADKPKEQVKVEIRKSNCLVIALVSGIFLLGIVGGIRTYRKSARKNG